MANQEIEDASERAWSVYCMMNPAAAEREDLKAALDDYLLETAMHRASTNLPVDGLKYLKAQERLASL